MVKCAYCEDVLPAGEPYVAYGGICWCSEACVADFMMGKDSITVDEAKIREMEADLEHRTVEDDR